LLFYSAGISALAAHKYDTLIALLSKPVIQGVNTNQPVHDLCALKIISKRMGKILFNGQEVRTPGSDYVNQTLRPFFKNLLPSDEDYNMWFDLWEYLRALIETDLNYNPTSNYPSFGTPGSFAWRRRDEIEFNSLNIPSNWMISSREKYVIQLWDSELEKISSTLIKKGFFQGFETQYLKTKDTYRDFLKNMFLRQY
jgi:hypothetical protein